MLSFDRSGTKAILIGTTRSESDNCGLPELPAVRNNIEALARIFRNPDVIGLEEDCVKSIIDPRTPTELLRELSRLARQATDTLVVYYAGHGLKSPSVGGLFIATLETTQEECHLDGVEFSKIKSILYHSPASKKILIFDCCFSGEINHVEMGGNDNTVIKDNITIKGTYSIASAPRNRPAFALPGESYTSFTKEFIAVLQEGIRDPVEYLTLDRIYDELRRRIVAYPNLPPPQRSVELDVDEFVFAKNVFFHLDPNIRISKLKEEYRAALEKIEQQAREREKQLEALATQQEAEFRTTLAKVEQQARGKEQKLEVLIHKLEEQKSKLSDEHNSDIEAIKRDAQVHLVDAIEKIKEEHSVKLLALEHEAQKREQELQRSESELKSELERKTTTLKVLETEFTQAKQSTLQSDKVIKSLKDQLTACKSEGDQELTRERDERQKENADARELIEKLASKARDLEAEKRSVQTQLERLRASWPEIDISQTRLIMGAVKLFPIAFCVVTYFVLSTRISISTTSKVIFFAALSTSCILILILRKLVPQELLIVADEHLNTIYSLYVGFIVFTFFIVLVNA